MNSKWESVALNILQGVHYLIIRFFHMPNGNKWGQMQILACTDFLALWLIRRHILLILIDSKVQLFILSHNNDFGQKKKKQWPINCLQSQMGAPRYKLPSLSELALSSSFFFLLVQYWAFTYSTVSFIVCGQKYEWVPKDNFIHVIASNVKLYHSSLVHLAGWVMSSDFLSKIEEKASTQ